jgi:hypothetical protein
MVGQNWPNQGELGKLYTTFHCSQLTHSPDIYEGVHLNTYDQVTLHTSPGCAPNVGPGGETGRRVDTTGVASSLTLAHPTALHSTPTVAVYTQACGQAPASKCGTFQAGTYLETFGTATQTPLLGVRRLPTLEMADAISIASLGT